MNMRLRDFTTYAVVCMVVLGALPLGLGSAVAASGGLDNDESLGKWNGKTTPATAAMFDGGFDASTNDDVVTHTGDGLPGWYVSYSDNSSYDSLRDWINSSDDRRELEHDEEDNRVLLAAPGDHIRSSEWFGLKTSGLSTRSYVDWIEVEQRVEVVDPVSPKSRETIETKHEPGGFAKFLTKTNGGSYALDAETSQGVAYDSEVNRTDMGDVKETIAADSDSIPARANGSGTTIAVLDTGANVANGEVFGNGTAGSELRITHGKNFVENTTIDTAAGNYSAIADGDGHGTYTAARIAGAGGGNAKLRSPAYDANLAVAKVLGDDGSGSIENIVDGLEWACSDQVDADVISMSLGSSQYSKVVEDEIHTCLEDDGVSAVVVAAGNSRWTTGRANVGSPADSDGVVSVTATTTGNASTLEVGYFANTGEDDGIKDGSGTHTRGKTPDIGAPGFENQVLSVDENQAPRNVTLTGTSMSTPDVASATAVLLDEHPEIKGDHEQVRERLLETATPAPQIGVTESEHGVLNVSNALDDERPKLDQEDVITEQAESRDNANRALSGHWGTWLAKNGVEL